MNGRKAFRVSFLVSMIFVLGGFGLLYFAMSTDSRETDTPQQGVPMMVPGIEDSKTIMVAVGDECPYFFIFKFNALQNKVGIGCISPSYEFSDGDSLADSLAKAGIMQCVLDTKEEFGINIDYYLHCDWGQMGEITAGLTEFGIDELGENLPVTVQNYLLKGAQMLDGEAIAGAAEKAEAFLDNELGLAFLTEGAWCMVKYNMENLSGVCGKVIKEDYSDMVTNLNTNRIKGMDRIINFLSVSHVEYPRVVIVKGDERRQEKIDSIIE